MVLSNELKELKKDMEERRKRLKVTFGDNIMNDMDELLVNSIDIADSVAIDMDRVKTTRLADVGGLLRVTNSGPSSSPLSHLLGHPSL
jgi:hypothetical protein